MAISVIGGAATSASGSSAPGAKLQIGGFSSTGTFTTTVPAGDYLFVGSLGSTLTCNGGTVYAGFNTNTNTYGTPVRIAGTQSVTVNTGLVTVASRLGGRGSQVFSDGASRWNRNKVLWNGTRFAFPDLSTSGTTPVWTSTDGVTWTSNSTTFVIGQCFMLANSVFFAGDNGNTNTFYTSSDAITWTQRTFPTTTIADGKLVAVVYASGRYVAFVRRASGNSFAVHTFTSTDATTWTYGASGVGLTMTSGDYGIFVASNGTTIVTAGDGATANQSLTYSTNGTSWTGTGTTAIGTSYYWGGLEYVGSYFVTVAASNTTNYANVYTSTNGQGAFGPVGTSLGYGSGAYMATGINFDGTNYVVTMANSNQNAPDSVGSSTNISAGLNTSSPFGRLSTTGLPGIAATGSHFAGNRWFFSLPVSYISGSDAYTGTSQSLTYLSTSFPTFRSPNTFGLYRYGDNTILN